MGRDAGAPLFLIGAARSGTSLLYKALCLHPEAAWISNWVRRAPGLPALAALNRVAPLLPHTRRRVWFGSQSSNAYVYGRPRSVLERAFPMPVEGEPVFARCGVGEHAGSAAAREGAGGAAAEVDSGRRQAALRRSFAAVRKAGGGKVVVNKRIANNRRIPLLAGAFPDARFAVLTRDGRAVALSLSRVDWWDDSRVWFIDGTPRQWREAGGDPMELCARHWVEEVAEIDRGIAAVGPERVLELSYERFIAAPAETLSAVARFGGLGEDARWRAELAFLRFPDQNAAWPSALGAEAVARITAVQGDTLARRGYIVAEGAP